MATRISAWEDDPLALPSLQPVSRPEPEVPSPGFAVRIVERRPAPRAYPEGTREFRYWNAADALSRASRYWTAAAAPDRTWQGGDALNIYLNRGEDLNAFYDRDGLSFFHATVRGRAVYSGESPDVLCHEHGHAVLDAVRPQLWNAASLEVDAFHEAFGDIAAMVSALQLPTLRRVVLEETGGQLARTSRLSRLAEQLGWAIRQRHPDAAESDCLRNAANSFQYREPSWLPPGGPAATLTAEPHSFSRVFTAAWLEAFAGMVLVAGGSARDVAPVARDAGRLLVAAVRDARITSNYFAQVAAHLLREEHRLFKGTYQDALATAFVRRGILAPISVRAVLAQLGDDRTVVGERGAVSATETVQIPFDGWLAGLSIRELLVEAGRDSSRSVVQSASPDRDAAPAVPSRRAAEVYVAHLFRRGRVSAGRGARSIAGSGHRQTRRVTHTIVRDGRTARLVRTRFHQFEGGCAV